MFIKSFSRLILFVGPLLVLGYMILAYYEGEVRPVKSKTPAWKDFTYTTPIEKVPGAKVPPEKEAPEKKPEEEKPAEPKKEDPPKDAPKKEDPKKEDDKKQEPLPKDKEKEKPKDPKKDPEDKEKPKEPPVDHKYDIIADIAGHREIFAQSTLDRKYWKVDLGPGFEGSINPNIIPHPVHNDAWLVIAQRDKVIVEDAIFEEVSCTARFQLDGSLACTEAPTALPVVPTKGDKCEGKTAALNLNVGPHDMRVFYGPDFPYSIYGTQSAFACFGQYVQHFEALVPDFGLEAFTATLFVKGTELQRPAPWGEIEKNWFMFWDKEGQMYVHHDMEPNRVFAQLTADGTVGPDLGPLAAATDDACMAKYMPKITSEDENIHQATNSLSITLCKRSDPTCISTDENTFIFTIFQHKTYRDMHGMYEPYVMLFRQSLPFSIHSISSKPLWIYGRGLFTKDSGNKKFKEPDAEFPNHSEQFYITSMSWKTHGQKYHGYMDDVLFLGFGIEDSKTAAIDVLASDLLQDMGICG